MRFWAGKSLADKVYEILIIIGKFTGKYLGIVLTACFSGISFVIANALRRKIRVFALIIIISAASIFIAIESYVPRAQWPVYQQRRGPTISVVQESAMGKMATVSVRMAYLREEPSLALVSGSEVPPVRTVKMGEEFKILREQEDWYLLQLSLTGDSAWIKSHCTTVAGLKKKQINATKNPDNISGNSIGKKLDEICRGEKSSAIACSAAIIKNGEVAYAYNYGIINKSKKNPVTSDTKFRIGTLSAFPTTLGFMTLEQVGRMSLEDSLEDYMYYPMRNPYKPGVPFNMRHLLTNTSGLRDTTLVSAGSNEGAPLKDLMKRKSFFFDFEPDKKWSLSSSGFGVAGAAVEKTADVYFPDYMDVALFKPLGMTATYDPSTLSEEDKLAVADCYMAAKGPPEQSREKLVKEKKIQNLGENFYLGNANCFISSRDLGTLVAIMASGGKYGGQDVIMPAAISKMEKIYYENSEIRQCLALRYGEKMYGGNNLYYLSGGMYGVRAMVAYSKEKQCGVAIITNGAVGNEDDFGNYTACSEIIEEIFKSGLI